MAHCLAGAGYALAVNDLDAKRSADFIAGHRAEAPASLAALAEGCDAVITILPDGKAVRAVVLGEGGARNDCLAAGMKPGSVLIDMSSSSPVDTRALAAALAERGIALVDAPVSGGVKRAIDGTLATMVGGDAKDVERCRPVLAAMCKFIYPTGPVGSGHAMKALNNLVSGAGFWIAAEAMLVGKHFGLNPETMVDVLNASSGRNNSTENKIKQQILSRAFGSGFSIGLMAKDLSIAGELAASAGSFAPLTRECVAQWVKAAAEMGGGADHTMAVKYLERLNGEELK